MLSRSLRRAIAFAALVISVLWSLTYTRYHGYGYGYGNRGRSDSWLFWEVGLILGAGVLVAVWVLFFTHDPAPWLAAGRTMGFKSIYSERLPKPPFELPEHISDVLGRSGPEFDVYLAHRCEQDIVTTTQRGLFSRDDSSEPSLFENSEQSLTEPYPVETFALINSRRLMLPLFQMCPEGIVDKLVGHADVDFDSHPKFSRRYRLWGASEADLRVLFTPALLDFFSERSGWRINAHGGWLILRRDSVQVSPKELPAFVREVLELHAALADACA